MDIKTLLLRQMKEEQALFVKHSREVAEMRIRHERERLKLKQTFPKSMYERSGLHYLKFTPVTISYTPK